MTFAHLYPREPVAWWACRRTQSAVPCIIKSDAVAVEASGALLATPEQPVNAKPNCETWKAGTDQRCRGVDMAGSAAVVVAMSSQHRQRNEGQSGNQCHGGEAQVFHGFDLHNALLNPKALNFVPLFGTKTKPLSIS
jgi:hypothetical protein